MASKKQDDGRPKIERGALVTIGRAAQAMAPVDEGALPDDLRKLVERLKERDAKKSR